MKELHSHSATVAGKPVWKKAIGALLRASAWLYDFVIAFIVVAWWVWGALVQRWIFGCSGQAWVDYSMGWEQDIYAFELERGLSEGLAHFIAGLPLLFEYVLLMTLSALLVRWVRRFVRTTPGEWTFSVRREPLPPPGGGVSRRLGRIVAGLVALFVGALVCAGMIPE